MAPPGVYTFHDQLDIMTISSSYQSLSTSATSLLASPPSSPTSPACVSGLATVQSDHDYVLKPVEDKHLSEMVSSPAGLAAPNSGTAGHRGSAGGDAMLSSCALDVDPSTDEVDDTDFLQELDDLEFSLDDLDPCNDMAMAESFQDFIDSALEQSYSAFRDQAAVDVHTGSQVHNTDIFNKEDFLRMLDLKPAQRPDNVTDFLASSQSPLQEMSSPSSSLPTPSASLQPASVISTTTVGVVNSSGQAATETPCSTSSLSVLEDCSPLDVIPTKRCSCSGPDSASTPVYSTAHSAALEDVQTCPSTLNTNKNSSLVCANCSISRAKLEGLMSPLFIDTSSHTVRDSFQPLWDECLAALMEEDMPAEVDEDVSSFLKWLSDNQQQSHRNGNNNDMDSSPSSCTTGASTVTETSRHGGDLLESLDMESFADLEDIIMPLDGQSGDDSQQQHTVRANDINDSSRSFHDHTYQRSADESKLEEGDEDVFRRSQLKLSILAESHDHLGESGKHTWATDCFLYHTDCLGRVQDLKCSDSDYDRDNHLSRILSASDLSPAASPSPLPSTEFFSPSQPQSPMEACSIKNNLALLNLFSDENVSTLFHAESAVPSIRLM